MAKWMIILIIVSIVATTAIVIMAAIISVSSKSLRISRTEKQKYTLMYKTSLRWIQYELKGKTVEECLIRMNCHNVAIYGMSDLGILLFDSLAESAVRVEYCIDRTKSSGGRNVKVYSPDEDFPGVDLVVVSAIYYYEEIKEMLGNKGITNVISLEELFFDSFRN